MSVSFIEFYNSIRPSMDKNQLNLYLDVDLISRIKHAAIDEERRLSDFVANALEQYLAERNSEDEEDNP